MELIVWKSRYAWHMRQRSDMPWNWCWDSAGCAIENDPDDIYTDGPVYYAQEEMTNWSD